MFQIEENNNSFQGQDLVLIQYLSVVIAVDLCLLS